MMINILFDGTFDRHYTREAVSQASAEAADGIRSAIAEHGEPGRWEATVYWHEERQAFSVELRQDGERIDRRPMADRNEGDFLHWDTESNRGRQLAFMEHTRQLLRAHRERLTGTPAR